jgi:Ca2+-binding RTX toxin-like protein
MATVNGTSGNDNLKGTATADRINGLAGNDILNGGKGNDTLAGGEGVDTLKGGAGNDLYLLTRSAGAHDAISDTGGLDTVIVFDAGLSVLAAGLEILILRGDTSSPAEGGLLDAVGNDLDNTIRNERTALKVALNGKGGDDVLFGSDVTDDFVFGGDVESAYGNDFAEGGGGRDRMLLGFEGRVVANFADGFAQEGGFGSVTFTDIETIGTGHFNDSVIGDAGANSIYTGGGNDTVRGGGGNDDISGDLRVWPDMGGQYEGRDRLFGDGGRDTLNGGNGDDYLNGGSGADRLEGGAGNDRLVWDSSDLVLNGGSGSDRLLAAASLDLRDVPQGRIVDVESIDMTGGGNNRLTLTEAELLDISSSTDTLTVFGNAGDSINIVGAFLWQGNSDGFRRYQVGGGFLMVDADISSVS